MGIEEKKSVIRKSIAFYGWVQGVGFRYRAKHAAQTYHCTGWVHNEFDGSVKMEIQGTSEDINKVLSFIGESRYIRIERTEINMIPVEQTEYGFYTR